MIVITVHGRLAHQPEVRILPGGASCCEFRLLSTRFAKGEEHVEAVTFFCYGEEAERFCENTEKGQLISATGSQETQRYQSHEVDKHFVKYRLTWFEKGPKPFRGQGRGTDSGPQLESQRPAARPASAWVPAATTGRANEAEPRDGASDGFI
jgi:single-stranded DNA-binding protein